MAELNFLPLATDSWVADTAHLTRAERGLYHDLIVLIWRSPECRVPNDIEWIARRLRCDEGEKLALQNLVSEFLSSTGNWLFQKRLLKEFQRTRGMVKKQSERAKSRWNKEKDESRGNANANAPAMPPTPTPTLIPLSKDNGEVVPKINPEKQFWTDAKAWLVERGKTEAQAGSLVGKWLKEHGKELTVAALNAGQLERAVDPVAYVTGYFRRHGQADDNHPSFVPMRTAAPC